MNAYIKAISYHLPKNVLSNRALVTLYPNLNEEQIYRSTAIKSRHISDSDEIGSDLGFHAAEKLFFEHAISKDEVDFLLFCSEGLDYSAPATACILQDRLGLNKNCGTLDIPYGCTGFVYGLSVAKGLIESGQASNVLLITSDVPSKVIHPEDIEMRLIFGDAGAATLISNRNQKNGIGKFVFGTDGSGFDKLIVRKSGIRDFMTADWLEFYAEVGGMKLGRMEMKASDIFLFAMKVVPQMVKDLLAKENLAIEDIDFFVFHQANSQMLEVLRKKIRIPKEKFIIEMEDIGNTVSASIPIALSRALNIEKIKKGNRIMICGFGIGLSWSGTILEI